MTMMDQLLSRAEDLRPALRNLLSSYIASNVVQGAVLEVDRHWLQSFLRSYYSLPSPFKFSFWIGEQGLYDTIEWNFAFRPPDWEQHSEIMGYPPGSGPLFIRIILNPVSKFIGDVRVSDLS